MRARGFTLVELMVVIVMMSMLTAVVSPGMTAIRETQRDAGFDEIRRMLRSSQQVARATGRPHGVWVDCAAGRCGYVWIDDSDSVSPAPDGLGAPAPIRSMVNDFGGITITELDPGDGASVGEAVIWFDFRGRPEVRDIDGSSPTAPTTNPTVSLEGLPSIVVDRVTGVLQ